MSNNTFASWGEYSRQLNASLGPTSVSDGACLMLVCVVNVQCCTSEQYFSYESQSGLRDFHVNL